MVSLIGLTIIFLWVVPFLTGEAYTVSDFVGMGIGFSISSLLVWILLDTKYTITNKHIYYCSGPIRGKIEVMSIQKIEHVTTWYVGPLLKPALGDKGLTIRYHKFKDIYISPKDKERFIAELLKINPDIKVV